MRNKYLIGFLAGMLILIVLFCVAVLIMASVKNTTFIEVIRSWVPAAPAKPEANVIATTVGLKI